MSSDDTEWLTTQYVSMCARLATPGGACSICGRALSDRVSRALGVGPECRGRDRARGRLLTREQYRERLAEKLANEPRWFAIGPPVDHPRYGPGWVIEYRMGKGESGRATVQFERLPQTKDFVLDKAAWLDVWRSAVGIAGARGK